MKKDKALIRYYESLSVDELCHTVEHSSNLAERLTAAMHLGRRGREAVRTLARILEEQRSANVHAAVLVALKSACGQAEEAVPALTRFLKDGKHHPDLRCQAVECLAGMFEKAGAALPVLLERLQDPNEDDDVRNAVASAIVSIRPRSGDLPLLMACLSSRDVGHRQEIIRAIGRLGPEAAESVPALIAILEGPEQNLRWCAAEALASIGKVAVPPLLKALFHENKSVTEYAALALQRVRPVAATAVPALLQFVADQDKNVQIAAIKALGAIGTEPDKIVPALVGRLKAGDPEVAVAVCQSLRMMESRAAGAVPALIEALGSRHKEVRRWAADVLHTLGPSAREAIPALLQAIKSKDWGLRATAAAALGSIGDAVAVPALVLLLKDKVGAAATKALGLIGADAAEAVPALVDVLATAKSSDGRLIAAEALARIGPAAKAATPALIRRLDDRDADVRIRAAQSLVQLGAGAEAVPSLVKRLKDPQRFVRMHMARALWKIAGDERALRTLIAGLDESQANNIRSLAVDGLLDIGPAAKEAVPALIKALPVTENKVGERAAEALRRIDPAAARQAGL